MAWRVAGCASLLRPVSVGSIFDETSRNISPTRPVDGLMKHVLALATALALPACSTSSPSSSSSTAQAKAPAPASESTTTLSVGDAAPAFSLPGPTGSEVSLASLTASGPAVLVFYRGDW